MMWEDDNDDFEEEGWGVFANQNDDDVDIDTPQTQPGEQALVTRAFSVGPAAASAATPAASSLSRISDAQWQAYEMSAAVDAFNAERRMNPEVWRRMAFPHTKTSNVAHKTLQDMFPREYYSFRYAEAQVTVPIALQMLRAQSAMEAAQAGGASPNSISMTLFEDVQTETSRLVVLIVSAAVRTISQAERAQFMASVALSAADVAAYTPVWNAQSPPTASSRVLAFSRFSPLDHERLLQFVTGLITLQQHANGAADRMLVTLRGLLRNSQAVPERDAFNHAVSNVQLALTRRVPDELTRIINGMVSTHISAQAAPRVSSHAEQRRRVALNEVDVMAASGRADIDKGKMRLLGLRKHIEALDHNDIAQQLALAANQLQSASTRASTEAVAREMKSVSADYIQRMGRERCKAWISHLLGALSKPTYASTTARRVGSTVTISEVSDADDASFNTHTASSALVPQAKKARTSGKLRPSLAW